MKTQTTQAAKVFTWTGTGPLDPLTPPTTVSRGLRISSPHLCLSSRLRNQRKAVVTTVDKKIPNGILEEQDPNKALGGSTEAPSAPITQGEGTANQEAGTSLSANANAASDAKPRQCGALQLPLLLLLRLDKLMSASWKKEKGFLVGG
nr:receptor-type tyrosine-protein phosphatase epsilon-like [Paramormyrops kingsleyae]